MSDLRILFIGGTGVISSACVSSAVEAGFDVSVVNRGTTSARPTPPEVSAFTADVRDPASMSTALAGRNFDVVVDFLSFTPEHVRATLSQFRGRIGQLVFISSASTYQTPPTRLPIVESTPLGNPFWQYSRDKIACEDLLVAEYRESGLPVTIVRPSHTYDATSVPVSGGWTVIERMRRGAAVVVHGDGTSLWALTHHTDFARAFTRLLGNPGAIGESYHITSDETLSWNQIVGMLAEAAGAEPEIVHVPSDAIASVDPGWGASLLGDKAHSMIFDNSRIKAAVPGWQATVPFWRGAKEIVAWHDADADRRVIDPGVDDAMDRLVKAYRVT